MSSKNSKTNNKQDEFHERNQQGPSAPGRNSMNKQELHNKLEKLAVHKNKTEDTSQPGKSAVEKHVQFDEENVQATYKPEGRDYGLMKVDEPVTPYASYGSLVSEDGANNENETAFVTSVVGDELVVRRVPRKVFEKKRSDHYRGEFRKNIPPPEPDVEDAAQNLKDDSSDSEEEDGRK